MYEKAMLNGYMQNLYLWNAASSSADEQSEQTVNSPIPNGGKAVNLIITTELCSGFQGLGDGDHQQAFCNSCRMALLAATVFRMLLVGRGEILPEKSEEKLPVFQQKPTGEALYPEIIGLHFSVFVLCGTIQNHIFHFNQNIGRKRFFMESIQLPM